MNSFHAVHPTTNATLLMLSNAMSRHKCMKAREREKEASDAAHKDTLNQGFLEHSIFQDVMDIHAKLKGHLGSAYQVHALDPLSIAQLFTSDAAHFRMLCWADGPLREALCRRGSALYIDSMHCVTRYDFHVGVITVIDEWGRNMMGALAVFKSETTWIWEDFIRFVLSGSVSVSVDSDGTVSTAMRHCPGSCTSDGDGAIRSAVKNVFEEDVRHVRCTRHLLKDQHQQLVWRGLQARWRCSSPPP